MARYLLGIDNGGTVTKAALYELNGAERHVESERSTPAAMPDGLAERSMAEMWEANVRVISRLLAASGVTGEQIMAISVTGHGDGLYLLGDNGRTLCNAVLSSDRRAEKYVQRWYQDGTFNGIFERTMQSIWAGQSAPILAWFVEHKPEILRETRSILMCKDYVRYRLTGEIFGEYTDMSGSGLLNVVDGTYDTTLLGLYGIECVRDKLPPLLQSSEVGGQVTREAAALTGLLAGTPVVAGMWDIVACSIANGLVDESRLCVVAGTWSINEYISSAPPQDNSVFITARYCVPGYWLTLEGSPTSASNLEWFVERFLRGRREQLERDGSSLYDYCNSLVAGVAPRSSRAVFLPFLFGSNAGAGTRACFFGLDGWHDEAEILTAIYEGIVFSHRTHIEKLSTYRTLPPTVRLSGGAARSPVWVQMFADGLGLNVEVNTSRETGALGAALCAGVGVGHFSSFEDAVENMVHIPEAVPPRREYVGIYDEKYADYKAAVEACQAYTARARTS